ncbi:unnamed protein product [Echinostoma caproni]|uniref:UPAR/Ly6 domain-containing protein n=1 Tax=Echinostoma caproni TaxID=27848 RepID=A0A183AM75_9TREM|nr:unnamed protein product [Echinostoma caproni]
MVVAYLGAAINAISCYECKACDKVNRDQLKKGCINCSVNIITEKNVSRIDARFCHDKQPCEEYRDWKDDILYETKCCNTKRCNTEQLKSKKKKKVDKCLAFL